MHGVQFIWNNRHCNHCLKELSSFLSSFFQCRTETKMSYQLWLQRISSVSQYFVQLRELKSTSREYFWNISNRSIVQKTQVNSVRFYVVTQEQSRFRCYTCTASLNPISGNFLVLHCFIPELFPHHYNVLYAYIEPLAIYWFTN